MAQRIMILATNGFEQSELEEAQGQTSTTPVTKPWSSASRMARSRAGTTEDWGNSVDVDLTVDEAEADEFDALVLPGGQMNPDILRMNDKAVQLVKDFCAAGKPVAAICHAPWMLVEAGVVNGKTVTSWPIDPHRPEKRRRQRGRPGSRDRRQPHHQPQPGRHPCLL